MNVLQLIASSSFVVVNKQLVKELGLEEALMLGELASEYSYWLDREELTDDGYFYSTVENVEDNTGLSDYKQRKALNSLKQKGLVDVDLRGLPAKRFVKIFEEQLLKLFENKISKNLRTDTQKIKELELKNFDINNNKGKKNNNKNKEREVTDYQEVIRMYNETCVSFPRIRSLSEARKKAIKARLKHYSIEEIREVFRKAEASSFLKGGNSRDWSATFDWLIKDANMAKVLDGNYDDYEKQKEPLADVVVENIQVQDVNLQSLLEKMKGTFN